MNRRIHRILEVLWLGVALLSMGAAIHKSISAGFRDSVIFFLITFIAAVMYMLRRNLRKKSESPTEDA
jgi:pilus assembly protein TadC